MSDDTFEVNGTTMALIKVGAETKTIKIPRSEVFNFETEVVQANYKKFTREENN